MMHKPPLRLDGVSKRYGDRFVLHNVSLEAWSGKITTVLGASGAGKSTLLRLIAGLERPTQGVIKTGETELSSPRHAIAPETRNIGVIFQDFALFPNMTVLENVKFGLRKGSKTDRTLKAKNWIDALSMAHRIEAYPHQMSGGEQQRIAIARALAANPDAIMMDEPFSGLDPETRSTVREIALKAIKDAAIPAIMVTHDPAEALAYSDMIAVLEAGEIAQIGTPDEIYLSPIKKSVAQAFGPLYALNAQDIPAPWHAVLPQTQERLYYRDTAFKISDAPNSAPIEIEAIRRTGALHQITGKLPSGAPLIASILLESGDLIGDTIHLSPLPHLFYAF